MQIDFFKAIYSHALLKKEDYEEISKAHTKIEFSQGAILLENGKIAREFYIIERGLFRSFLYDYNGNLAKEAGFTDVKIITTKDMEKLYFADRPDNLSPASGEIFLLATVSA